MVAGSGIGTNCLAKCLHQLASQAGQTKCHVDIQVTSPALPLGLVGLESSAILYKPLSRCEGSKWGKTSLPTLALTPDRVIVPRKLELATRGLLREGLRHSTGMVSTPPDLGLRLQRPSPSRIILCGEDCVVLCGMLGSIRASTLQVPGSTRSGDNQKCLQTLPYARRELSRPR